MLCSIMLSSSKLVAKTKSNGQRLDFYVEASAERAGVFERVKYLGRKKTVNYVVTEFKCEVASNCSALEFTPLLIRDAIET